MPVRRVLFLEPDPAGPPEYREASMEVRRVLAGRGISVTAGAADGCIVSAGAIPSLDPLFERHLDGHDRPCGLLNTANYYTDLLRQAPDSQVERFARETQRGRLIVERDPAALVNAVLGYRPPETRRQSGAAE